MAPIPARPVHILTVGRAVDKKGFDDLLAALARIPPDRHWRLTHIGGGPMLAALKATARTLGLAERVEWRGPQAQAAVLEAYRGADIFALPCRLGADGDRDGLPNVLLEAQSQKLACVSTRISGIPELIQHDVTGLLVEPRAIDALAAALGRLIADPRLRRRLGENGFARAVQHVLARRRRGPARGPIRGRVRVACRPLMKVAFYAPLKPVDHPVPSGDRQVGRALLDALRAGGHDDLRRVAVPHLRSARQCGAAASDEGARASLGARDSWRASSARARVPPSGSRTTSTTRRRTGWDRR